MEQRDGNIHVVVLRVRAGAGGTLLAAGSAGPARLFASRRELSVVSVLKRLKESSQNPLSHPFQDEHERKKYNDILLTHQKKITHARRVGEHNPAGLF